MLPRVKIQFENGSLGSVTPSADGESGLVAHAEAVEGLFSLATPYVLTKLESLEALGIDSESTGANGRIYKTVKEFYAEAPEGSRLWLMGVSAEVSAADVCDPTKNHIKPLLEAAKGAIRLLMVQCNAEAEPEMSGSIAAVTLTMKNSLQRLAEQWTESKYAPFMSIIEAQSYNGTASGLPDLGEGNANRVAVVLGDSERDSAGAAIGLVCGRLAAEPVQRSLGRVRSGAIASDEMYIGGVEAGQGDSELAHDRGYIVPRCYVGKAGYYWSDDKLATVSSDDYAFITRRRTIDKAYRIAYKTLVDEIGEEVPVNAEGQIAAYHCKGIETAVESAIVNQMTSEGNLGNDPEDANDLGVKCWIDPNQNILATSRFEISLKVKPYGYSKYIDVKLGFKTA